MKRTKTYFAADMHLGARYITDHRAHEARVTAFLDSIKDEAKRLYLLGDVLDYWFEYNSVVPRGHVRFFGKLAELADSGVEITWMTGNHDVWLRDYLRDEIGMTVVTGQLTVDINGHRFLLSHGDDIGPRSWNYRFMKWCFLNPVCQWLYAGIHPNISHRVATSWSSHNRTSRKIEHEADNMATTVAMLNDGIEQISREHPDIEYFVTGHLHCPGITHTASGATSVRLGDWLNGSSYAVWDGEQIELTCNK